MQMAWATISLSGNMEWSLLKQARQWYAWFAHESYSIAVMYMMLSCKLLTSAMLAMPSYQSYQSS